MRDVECSWSAMHQSLPSCAESSQTAAAVAVVAYQDVSDECCRNVPLYGLSDGEDGAIVHFLIRGECLEMQLGFNK